MTPHTLQQKLDAYKNAETTILSSVHPADHPPSDLAGFPSLPSPGTGMIIDDADLLESLQRDGHTLGDRPPSTPAPTPMDIALAWVVGMTAGTILTIIAALAIIGMLKVAGKL